MIFTTILGFLSKVPAWLYALVAVAAWGWYGHHELDRVVAANQKALLEATQAAREKEKVWTAEVEVIKNEKTVEIGRVIAERDAALQRLRDRPARNLPGSSGATCTGATGAQLSGPDAGFLVGLAADADTVRAALNACQKYVEKVTK